MQTIKFPLKVILYKYGEMIYFSQLDLTHVLERAIRRTELPFYLTEGFNRRVRISFLDGLKLGQKGYIRAIFYFKQPISFSQLKEALLPQLPKGLDIYRPNINVIK